jgi:hypothetical protein
MSEPQLGRDPFEAAQRVADAVCYEGYVLYPYRASAAKNRVRWQFGVLVPPSVAERDPSERPTSRMECCCYAGPDAKVTVRLRLLEVEARVVEARVPRPGTEGGPGQIHYEEVPWLEDGGRRFTSFDEGVERELDLGPLLIDALCEAPVSGWLVAEPASSAEAILGTNGAEIGRMTRTRAGIRAELALSAERLDGEVSLYKLVASVANRSTWTGPIASRDDLARHSLASVHLLAAIDGGRFVSLVDPPASAAEAVSRCKSDGLHPVLVSAGGGHDLVLGAPIILSDYPAVAPESGGDFFDAAEIDEILALRVLTLTEDEKRAARSTDPRAAGILDRCEAMSPEAFAQLHGTVRSLRDLGCPDRVSASPAEPAVPWWDPSIDSAVDPSRDTAVVAGHPVGAGARVRLRPSRRADAQDLFVAGKMACVKGVFHDADGGVHVAVVVEDDPAAELAELQGRFWYFAPEEIELVEAAP